jgi:hypothetical protein
VPRGLWAVQRLECLHEKESCGQESWRLIPKLPCRRRRGLSHPCPPPGDTPAPEQPGLGGLPSIKVFDCIRDRVPCLCPFPLPGSVSYKSFLNILSHLTNLKEKV